MHSEDWRYWNGKYYCSLTDLLLSSPFQGRAASNKTLNLTLPRRFQILRYLQPLKKAAQHKEHNTHIHLSIHHLTPPDYSSTSSPPPIPPDSPSPPPHHPSTPPSHPQTSSATYSPHSRYYVSSTAAVPCLRSRSSRDRLPPRRLLALCLRAQGRCVDPRKKSRARRSCRVRGGRGVLWWGRKGRRWCWVGCRCR